MFVRYPSLENLHNVDTQSIPSTALVSVMEKVDGSNLSLILDRESYRFASRNMLVANDWNKVDELVSQELIKELRTLSFSQWPEAEFITFYGEVYSPSINRRIPYKKQGVVFYDVFVDGKPKDKMTFISLTNKSDYFGPNWLPANIMEFGKALSIDPNTYKSNLADAYAEGFVIQTATRDEGDLAPGIFGIKVKSLKFMEKHNKIRRDKEPLGYHQILEYVNKNRVLDYLSKIDHFDQKEMSKYISEISEDIWTDYTKDFMSQTKRDVLSKYSVGNKIAKLLLDNKF